jgi:microcystin-dependent protein
VPTAPTAANGTSTTQIATTAFVTSAVLSLSGNISGVLGTMATQNANAVAITGGTLTDVTLTNITDLAIIDGGTGASTAANARINLGLGTMATQNANAVAITGGTITGVDISNSTGLIPSGVIVMWSGSQASIPSGWVLCNGSNSTPDLRNRFVIGAGGSYPVGDFGGSKDQAVVAHTHTASSTVNDPGHNHAFTAVAQNTGGVGSGALTGGTQNIGNDGTYTGTTTTAYTGVIITTTVNSTGSSGLNANLPPYYALCYIMKT